MLLNTYLIMIIDMADVKKSARTIGEKTTDKW